MEHKQVKGRGKYHRPTKRARQNHRIKLNDIENQLSENKKQFMKISAKIENLKKQLNDSAPPDQDKIETAIKSKQETFTEFINKVAVIKNYFPQVSQKPLINWDFIYSLNQKQFQQFADILQESKKDLSKANKQKVIIYQMFNLIEESKSLLNLPPNASSEIHSDNLTRKIQIQSQIDIQKKIFQESWDVDINI